MGCDASGPPDPRGERATLDSIIKDAGRQSSRFNVNVVAFHCPLNPAAPCLVLDPDLMLRVSRVTTAVAKLQTEHETITRGARIVPLLVLALNFFMNFD